MHTCVCTLRVHEIHAPEGCTKKTCTHPKQSEVTKNITARSHLRTHVIVSKSCERRVRHACAHLRCPRVHARVYTCTQRVHVSAPFGCGLTSRGAERTVRYEKEKNAFKPHFVRSLARSAPLRLRSAPLPGCGLPSVEKKKKGVCDLSHATCHLAPSPNQAHDPHPSPTCNNGQNMCNLGQNVRLCPDPLPSPPQIQSSAG